ncbi:bifunctional adenosylcobinamide kinase/adenosylcobinamide-phosphate guanylyltransferase [Butyrivibrio sp. WCD3002]|uniref:bifunctional adenosylcobinamide kinase/adenosylcobinamide-phosphate guanylyltransferase n=1 Tax=Butyrivibrio sp. WCD3002 TaxID=1280676 RepID=UPI0003F90CAE|nr:bifunctional adenosylcobinamide kinase/adenosylcobinamide-phosphate guanylyltransferase [Butyrivibrio sp. WCD3002]
MTILVVGTPNSGKSEKAEELAVKLSEGGKKYYIATMIPFGEEGAQRVKRHLERRDGKGFFTIEKPLRVQELVSSVPDFPDSTCLLECMSNLIGNEMHDENNAGMSDEALADYITASVNTISAASKNTVIVTNHFPLEDENYDEDTKRYVKLIDMVNSRLRAAEDIVYDIEDGKWVKAVK